MRGIVALYVDVHRGPYPELLGLDACWGIERDATTYEGSEFVIAHPPCQQWSKLRHFAKDNPAEKACGLTAIRQVRKNGGILEHPAGSALFRTGFLPLPGEGRDLWGGETFAVAQADFGHQAEKMTWLYYVGSFAPPPIPKGLALPVHKRRTVENINTRSRHLSPTPFAEWLIQWLNLEK